MAFEAIVYISQVFLSLLGGVIIILLPFLIGITVGRVIYGSFRKYAPRSCGTPGIRVLSGGASAVVSGLVGVLAVMFLVWWDTRSYVSESAIAVIVLYLYWPPVSALTGAIVGSGLERYNIRPGTRHTPGEILLTGESEATSREEYKAGYRLPQGIWAFILIGAMGVFHAVFSGIQMLKAYLALSSSGSPEYTSVLPGMLARMLFLLLWQLALLAAFVAYCIGLARVARDRSLLITSNSARCLSKGSSAKEVAWQDVSAIRYLKLSRRICLIRVSTASGSLSIPGSCLYDAVKTVELIRKYARLTEERSDMLWTRFERRCVVQ